MRGVSARGCFLEAGHVAVQGVRCRLFRENALMWHLRDTHPRGPATSRPCGTTTATWSRRSAQDDRVRGHEQVLGCIPAPDFVGILPRLKRVQSDNREPCR